ncbi:MAG: hypothetical protein K0R00_892 [Herbinix sp.]|nr:hypothetical protein [Herbinix sp.]
MQNGYEKLANLIKNSGNKSIGNIFKAEMTGTDTCRVNGLILDRDDLLISDILLTGWYKSPTEYIEPLKPGDIVVVVRLDETTFAILERVV